MPDQAPSLRSGTGHNPESRSYLQLTNTHKRNVNFSKGISLSIHTILKGRSHSHQWRTNTWQTQKYNWIVSHIALLRIFSLFFLIQHTVFCSYIMISGSGVLLCVCACAHKCVHVSMHFILLLSSFFWPRFLILLYPYLIVFFLWLIVFLRERERRYGIGRVRGRMDLGGDEGEKTLIRIYCIKINLFLTIKKKTQRFVGNSLQKGPIGMGGGNWE